MRGLVLRVVSSACRVEFYRTVVISMDVVEVWIQTKYLRWHLEAIDSVLSRNLGPMVGLRRGPDVLWFTDGPNKQAIRRS